MSDKSAGAFVVFEGGDGAGKSTQIRLLHESLTAAGVSVRSTREPGGTDLGAQIRQLLLHGEAVSPMAEAMLFAADRAQHVERLIRPALSRGQTVLSDRYVDSTVAYQGARAELRRSDLVTLAQLATGGLVPDLTVLLDVAPQEGRARRDRADDRIEAEPAQFHQAVRQGFLNLAAMAPERYLVIDAARGVDDIASEVLERVAALPALAGVAGLAPADSCSDHNRADTPDLAPHNGRRDEPARTSPAASQVGHQAAGPSTTGGGDNATGVSR